MTETIISCKSNSMLDAVVLEMTDWTGDFIVKPSALEVVVPNSDMAEVRQFLKAGHIVTENIIFSQIDEIDEDE